MKPFRQSVRVWQDEGGLHITQTFSEPQKRSQAVMPGIPRPRLPGHSSDQWAVHLSTVSARSLGYLVYPFAMALWLILAIFWLLGWVIAESVRAARR